MRGPLGSADCSVRSSFVGYSVALRQAEAELRHEVEDHLAAHRRDAGDASPDQKIAEPVLVRETVAAVRLHGLIDTGDARLGRGVLCHVRRLTGTHVIA